jgi:biopolymer transport protein ExbD
MRFRRNKMRKTAHIEAAALSDILFFLLLFFLMVATMTSPQGFKVNLPRAEAAKQLPPKLVNVSIDGFNQLYVETSAVSEEEMISTLQARTASDPNTTVVLRADKNLSVNSMVHVMDVIHKLKVPMVLATDKNGSAAGAQHLSSANRK